MNPTPSVTSPIAYRPDIDGLRAVAVIAVICFHAKASGFSGGYVGVDVFFVISGYLITRLLTAQREGSVTQRLREFYLRRARRILPALLVMLGVSAAAAYTLFISSDFERFGRNLSLAAALLGNVGAWLNGGYYILPGRFSPLQHLWSIGVEEQFYLVYPCVFVLVSAALPRTRGRVLLALMLCSFMLCVWLSYSHPAANFYFSPPRAWQLLAGAMTALYADRLKTSPRSNELIALVALGVLIWTIATFTSTTRYPGTAALVPAASATALIATSVKSPTLVARTLALRPLVFTGLISYSLYLWHAPLMAFTEYFLIKPAGAAGTIVLFASIYAIATVSWLLIERPFRSRTRLRTDRSFSIASLAASSALIVAGVAIWRFDGVPQRFPEDLRSITAAVDSFYLPAPECGRPQASLDQKGELCSFGPQDATRKVLVWGDSHAFALLPAYADIAQARQVRIHFGAAGACRPLLGVRSRYDTDERYAACAEFNEGMLQAVARVDPDLVILNPYWGYPDTDLVSISPGNADTAAQVFAAGLGRVLARANVPHRQACIVLTVPSYEQPLPYAVAMAHRRGYDDAFVSISREVAHSQYSLVAQHVSALEARGIVRVVDPKDVLCAGATCELRNEKRELLYRDGNHLSIAGALFVRDTVDECFVERATTLSSAQ